MEILFFRLAAVLVGCAAATYTDIRTGLILDKITYPMIALGVILNLLEFNLVFFVVPAVVFAFGYLVYYSGGLGGGDVKLLTAIALLLPLYQNQPFILSTVLLAALASLSTMSVYYSYKYVRLGADLKENFSGLFSSALLAFLLALYLLIFSSLGMPLKTVLIFVVPLMLSLPFLAFRKGINKAFFLKKIRLGELEEDEVIARDFLSAELVQKLKLKGKGVISRSDAERLKCLGVKELPVYRSLPPFAPFILFGAIVSVLSPELFSDLFNFSLLFRTLFG